MTLIKTLQRQLTCVDLPWLPPADMTAARLVNEIVLAEETDEVTPGYYTSHFNLYLMAMEEIGADCQPIQEFLQAIRQGVAAEQALASLPIPVSTQQFVIHTLNSAQGPIHEVAAAFLLGREDIIPSMFRRLVLPLEQSYGFSCDAFRLYLDRHMHLDEEAHAPMGQRLLVALCANDRQKWEAARQMTERALQARCALWDGITQAIGRSSAGDRYTASGHLTTA